MDLLELLAADETADREADLVGAIRPGTLLTLADFRGWPDATLTVVSIRPVNLRQPRPDGTSHTHLIRTTSDHPGPRWSSYDREWWAWFVAKYMTIEEA